MFLNGAGQPLIHGKSKEYGQHRGPLLLSSAAFNDPIFPQNWSKCVVGSKEDILRYNNFRSFTENCSFKTLLPNTPSEIKCDESVIIVTLIPAGKMENLLESQLFYIDNGYTRYLIVDSLSSYLDFLPKAHGSFHSGIRKGIDVLYVNEELLNETTINEDLYSLVDLIKPKFIYGLRERELPKWLLDLRRINDIYKRLKK
ncbi:uncharacterized protein LOC108117173 [Drosophila eugracilis]|uniref:uncharacterized protein LOC108117173 n=1 Tax=Drosophila eugracilis TaxID=29029 RepID=UPI001BD94B3A|nr:uncharacterized protein LOC108117173 [Drosophila eugracilis]